MLSVKNELLAALAAELEKLSPGAGGKAAFESPKVAAHGDQIHSADVERFVGDTRRIVAGGTVLDRDVVAAMVERPRRGDPLGRLTDRQREVLGLMAQGRSNAAIAEQLSISEKAVVRHASNIYDELGLDNRPDDHRRVLAVVRYLSG